ncbi:ATP-binding cassette domain-containing protein [Klebsiella michiganensis]|uniref:ATP-binding cassette domain-containing protein n=1 Tax=Klebsiella michiganensis TaxID=1134687 RepID=UPI001C499765|nr:ABC transporter ATP-binding protein [Klebsiella michiganensis]
MNYLEAEDLTTGYGRQVISEALNCSFEAGTITSIIGPNGCGKSTLLKTLARILPAEKGKVFIKNQELQHFSSKEVAQELAILSQTPENTSIGLEKCHHRRSRVHTMGIRINRLN